MDVFSESSTLLQPRSDSQAIFKSYSYYSLSETAKSKVNRYVDSFLKSGQIGQNDFLEDAPLLFDTQPSAGKIYSSRKEILRIGDEILRDAIPDDILLEDSQEKRMVLRNEHAFILYHYLARYWAVREKADAVISLDTELAICYRNICLSSKIICLLDGKSENEADGCIQQLQSLKPNITNTFAKMGLDQEEEQLDSDYGYVLLRRGNAIRLCWLWDRVNIELFVSIAHDLLSLLTFIATQVSWSLYIFLAAIHLSGVIKAYVEARELAKKLMIQASDVFWAHLKLRRDRIVNDLIWGLANLACCFWLCGFGLLANIGDLVTGVLLCMDLGMALWRYKDDQKEHDDDIDGYNEELNKLVISFRTQNQNFKKKLGELNKKISDNNYYLSRYYLQELEEIIKDLPETDKSRHLELLWQINELHAKKLSCHNVWKDKKLGLYSDIIYAGFLVLAFSVFCSFYLGFIPYTFPMSIVMAAAISLAGATFLWRSANSGIELRGINRDKNNARLEYNQLIYRFIEGKDTLSENQKKQLYLKILQKGAQACYQEDKFNYTGLETLRETANRILIPTAIAMNFLFLPANVVGVPTYVFLLLGILVAAVVSSMVIKKYYKPESTKWSDAKGNPKSQPCFNKQEYDKFEQFLINEDMDTETKEEEILKIIQDGRRAGKVTLNNPGLFSPSKAVDGSRGDGIRMINMHVKRD